VVRSLGDTLARLLFAIFCCELGIFLIVFPWMDGWTTNRFATFSGGESLTAATFAGYWRAAWVSPYFRGAVSGLGVVNIYISLLEVFNMRRRPPTEQPATDDPLE